MALAPAPQAQPLPATAARTGGGAMTGLVILLFFAWGFVTVLNDPLIAKLKGLFSLNYAEAMLTQFAFFLGYFIFSAPAGAILGRIGYVRSLVLGLVIMAAGCLMFAPAARHAVYPGFLLALFCVASGITILQVAANPYIAVLGSRETSHSRLTLAQAFNSLGTFTGPFIGALFLLQNGVAAPASTDPAQLAAARIHEAELVQRPFLVIAGVLLALALLFWLLRRVPGPVASSSSPNPFRRVLLARPRLILGVLSIFVYVGAEVSIGSGLTNYLMLPSVLGPHTGAIGTALAGLLHKAGGLNAAQVAGTMVSIYWGLAMLGRFGGSFVLSRFTPGKVLCAAALTATALVLCSAANTGLVAAAAVLAVGLANSIMFPTIFTLALEGLGEETANGSALLCMAIVGGAIIPVIYGATADALGLGHALIVPACCYLVIAAYGLLTARRPA
ncbi:MAG: sugar MFS transporter [Acidocella sp.]|nr:sugar MFS transporter [Acidocella sp.]